MIKKIFLLVLIINIIGCGSVVKKPKNSGYLSDYSQLQMYEDRKNYLGYQSQKLGKYRQFIIEPVAMVFMQDSDEMDFTDEDLENLQVFVHENMVKLFQQQGSVVEIVDVPGPNVATLRIAITDVKKTIGALNVAIYTKVTGAGLGGVAIEGELLDSVTGEQLGALVHWGNGSRFLRAGFTKTGDAKILLKKWSRDLHSQLSALVVNHDSMTES